MEVTLILMIKRQWFIYVQYYSKEENAEDITRSDVLFVLEWDILHYTFQEELILEYDNYRCSNITLPINVLWYTIMRYMEDLDGNNIRVAVAQHNATLIQDVARLLDKIVDTWETAEMNYQSHNSNRIQDKGKIESVIITFRNSNATKVLQNYQNVWHVIL